MPIATLLSCLFLSPLPLPPLLLVHKNPIHEPMRGKMERFAVLPFSIGCVSQSSVAVSDSQPRKPQTESSPTPRKGGGESPSIGKWKNSLGFPPLPRPNFSAGLHKIIKSIKGLSQLFVEYEEEDEEMEMEIGCPTDVQHVAHIGWDGFNNVSNMKSWNTGPDILSLPSLSLRQFELAMAAQAGTPQAQGHHVELP